MATDKTDKEKRREIEAQIAKLRVQHRALGPGPGRKAAPDDARLFRMALLLVRGEADNPWQASLQVATQDPGPDQVRTVRKRIYGKYPARRAQLEAAARRHLVFLDSLSGRAREGFALYAQQLQDDMAAMIVAASEPAAQARRQLQAQIEDTYAQFARLLR